MVASTFHVGIDLGIQNKIGFMRSWRVHMGSVCVQRPIHMISTGFNEGHFEFRVNQELYGIFLLVLGPLTN